MRTFLIFLALIWANPLAAQTKKEPKGLATLKSGDLRKPHEADLPMGVRMNEGDVLEVYVDLKGRIYKRRKYQGVVPKVHDDPNFEKNAHKLIQRQGKTPRVTWIGFQQLAAASRVFIKTDRIVIYTLYKPDRKTIIIEFPKAMVPLKNNARQLLTRNFRSNIERVSIRENRRDSSVKVVIELNTAVGYIYRQDGTYIYIDVER